VAGALEGRSRIGYLEVAFECCHGDGDLPVLAAETTDGSVDDGEVRVGIGGVGIVAGHQAEACVGGTVKQPALLLFDCDVPYRLGVGPTCTVAGPVGGARAE
jgi:hypothetical protein